MPAAPGPHTRDILGANPHRNRDLLHKNIGDGIAVWIERGGAVTLDYANQGFFHIPAAQIPELASVLLASAIAQQPEGGWREMVDSLTAGVHLNRARQAAERRGYGDYERGQR